MTFQFTNNGSSTLASGVSNSATSMVVATGQGALFPSPSGGNSFRATLVRASDGAIEIVDVTSRSTDTMTVVRAQEGTTGLTLVTGDKFELRITAGYLNDTAALTSGNTFTKAQRGSFVALTDASTVAVDLSLANQFNLVLGGNRTLGTPTNGAAGQQGVINAYQDATGSRTLAYAWFWGIAAGGSITLSTAGCTKDMLAYCVDYWLLSTFTTTIATPGVMTVAGHGMISGQKCQLSTTGALPTGLAASTNYYVHVIDANTFHLCTSVANAAAGTYIATSGSQSGTHTIHCASGTISVLKATP